MDASRLYTAVFVGLLTGMLLFLGAVQALGAMGVGGALGLAVAVAAVLVLGFLAWLAFHGGLTHWLNAPGLPGREAGRVRRAPGYVAVRVLLRVVALGAGLVAVGAGIRLAGLLGQLDPVSADAFVLAGANFWLCVLGGSLALGLGCETANQALRLLRAIADGAGGRG